jgi:hypothetical protein
MKKVQAVMGKSFEKSFGFWRFLIEPVNLNAVERKIQGPKFS